MLRCKRGLQALLIDYIEKHGTKVNAVVAAVAAVFLFSQEVLSAIQPDGSSGKARPWLEATFYLFTSQTGLQLIIIWQLSGVFACG